MPHGKARLAVQSRCTEMSGVGHPIELPLRNSSQNISQFLYHNIYTLKVDVCSQPILNVMLLTNMSLSFFSNFLSCLHSWHMTECVDSLKFQRNWRTSLMWLNVPWFFWFFDFLQLSFVLIPGLVLESKRSHYQFSGPILNGRDRTKHTHFTFAHTMRVYSQKPVQLHMLKHSTKHQNYKILQ